ncbi:MAG: hypothetical protein ACOC9Z_05305, partial [Chloroflexota bacterium]
MDEQTKGTEAEVTGRRERIASLTAEAWKIGAQDPRRALVLSQEAYELAREAGFDARPEEM